MMMKSILTTIMNMKHRSSDKKYYFDDDIYKLIPHQRVDVKSIDEFKDTILGMYISNTYNVVSNLE